MRISTVYSSVALVLCVAFIGCGETAKPTASGDNSVTLANLQSADLLDGKEDHVIGKCYVCGLGMDGKPEHAAEFESYTAHLCSDACCSHFKENASQIVTNTAVPAAKAE